MDINKLLKALDDESNETLLNFTTDKIREMNLKILKELHLPKKEFLLAKYLQKNAGRVISREELLNKIWFGTCVEDRTVDVHVRHIRSKINIAPIRTIKAVGYIWDKYEQ